MKILSASQIREWDQYTILHEPISSIDLMERAATACADWILENTTSQLFYIFCGKGNNGGDGLAIARLLIDKNISVKIFLLNSNAKSSDDFNANLENLKTFGFTNISNIVEKNDFPIIEKEATIIDALFGTGLNRLLEDVNAALITHLNQSGNTIISVDMPSGMLCDVTSKNFPVIKASHTLALQCLKLAFLIPENDIYFGLVHILDIKLNPAFLETIETNFQLTDKKLIASIHKPRKAFSHKGNYGHALVVAGSYGKMGAAVLSTRACLRSGAGLVTACIPKCGYAIMQICAPEAMCKTGKVKKYLTSINDTLSNYSAIGIGPGINKKKKTAKLLYHIITTYKKPMIVDADALNILSQNKDWLLQLPENSIITPHPKEFERLFGKTKDDFEKTHLALKKSKELNIIIILKGHYSFIATPTGIGYFNTTGNAGMATGGSGDVLTGILTGLLAQDYSSQETALFGVYLHGHAGDKAAEKYGMDGMIAGDIVEYILMKAKNTCLL